MDEKKVSQIVVKFDSIGASNFQMDLENVDAAQMFAAASIIELHARSVWASGQAQQAQMESPRIVPVTRMPGN